MNCAPRIAALIIGTKEIEVDSSHSFMLFNSVPISDAESCLYNVAQYALNNNTVFMFRTAQEGYIHRLYSIHLMRATIRNLS